MDKILIDVIGKITSGDEIGSYVKVIDDSENSGGFIILTSSNINFENGYDNWVGDIDALQQYFKDSDWKINWMKG